MIIWHIMFEIEHVNEQLPSAQNSWQADSCLPSITCCNHGCDPPWVFTQCHHNCYSKWPFTHFTTLEPRTILPVSQTPLQPFFPTLETDSRPTRLSLPFHPTRTDLSLTLHQRTTYLSVPAIVLKSLKIASFGSHFPGLAKPERELWCHFPLPLYSRRQLGRTANFSNFHSSTAQT